MNAAIENPAQGPTPNPAPNTAPNPAKEARRKEILDAALQEFSAKGYAGASMAAIAARARASKETLYAWFENKESLFNTLLEQRLEEMTRRSYAAAGTDPSPAHLLPIIAEDLVRFTLASSPLSRVADLGESGDKARRLAGKSITEERKRFAAYLLRCRDEGYIAFDDDAMEIGSLFVAMAEGEWRRRLDTGMIDEVTDAMITAHAERATRVFLKGLAP
jgi:AcrR family transcriptional regulator